MSFMLINIWKQTQYKKMTIKTILSTKNSCSDWWPCKDVEKTTELDHCLIGTKLKDRRQL